MAKTMMAKVQEYWDRRPCNIRHSRADVDIEPLRYSEEVTRRKYFVEPHIPGFAQFEQWQGKKVLELGCGIGTDTISFAQAGARVTAMDISGKSLEIARKRAKAHGLRNARFICGDIEKIWDYIPLEQYDLVYSFGVLHHTPHPERVIQQVRDLFMGAHSTLKLMLYNRYSWKAFWILATFGKLQFWRWDELIARHSEAQTGCPITRPYTPEMARELLEGFAIEDLHVDHIFPYHIPDYIQHRYVKEWYWGWMPAAWFRWLERRIGWHLLVTARKRIGR